MNTQLQKDLEQLAFNKTIPFCYLCYQEAPSGRCKSCYSDDLMRLLPGVGVEYGIEWVVEALIEQHCNAIDEEELFEQSIADCYEPVQVGWITVDVADAIKALDPVSWRIAKHEHLDAMVEDGQLVNIGGQYYHASDIEDYLLKHLE